MSTENSEEQDDQAPAQAYYVSLEFEEYNQEHPEDEPKLQPALELQMHPDGAAELTIYGTCPIFIPELGVVSPDLKDISSWEKRFKLSAEQCESFTGRIENGDLSFVESPWHIIRSQVHLFTAWDDNESAGRPDTAASFSDVLPPEQRVDSPLPLSFSRRVAGLETKTGQFEGVWLLISRGENDGPENLNDDFLPSEKRPGIDVYKVSDMPPGTFQIRFGQGIAIKQQPVCVPGA